MAIASKKFRGKTWVTNSLRFRAEVFRPAATPASGSGTPTLAPGCNRLAKIRPMVSETSDAIRNHPTALPPMRPTVPASPMPANPATRVEKTRGAMIILTRRRKMSVTMAK